MSKFKKIFLAVAFILCLVMLIGYCLNTIRNSDTDAGNNDTLTDGISWDDLLSDIIKPDTDGDTDVDTNTDTDTDIDTDTVGESYIDADG